MHIVQKCVSNANVEIVIVKRVTRITNESNSME